MRVTFEAVRMFFKEFVSQLDVRIRPDGDQAGFYKLLKGVIPRARDRAASNSPRVKKVDSLET